MSVRVTPSAGRSEIAGRKDGDVIVLVKAPPTAGRANDECVGLIAGLLGIERSRVSIAAGRSGRRKTIAVEMDPEAVEESLADLGQAGR